MGALLKEHDNHSRSLVQLLQGFLSTYSRPGKHRVGKQESAKPSSRLWNCTLQPQCKNTTRCLQSVISALLKHSQKCQNYPDFHMQLHKVLLGN